MMKKPRAQLEEEMRYHLSCWQQSNQSQKQYCLDNHLPLYKFHYWSQKLRKQSNPLDDSFVPIDINSSLSHSNAEVELSYPNGVRLRIPSADLHLIGQLIRLV